MFKDGNIPWNFREGGQSKTNRRVRNPKWIKLKNTILDRDKNICKDCGVGRNLKILQRKLRYQNQIYLGI